MGAAPTEDPGLLGPDHLLRRAAPFLAVMLLGFVVYPLAPAADDLLPLAGAAAILLLTVVAIAVLPWHRLPRWSQLPPILAFFLVVALLRHGEGGVGSGLSALVILPLFWVALYGTPRELVLTLCCLGATFVVPLVVAGGDSYPASDWERAVVWMSAASVVGFSVQGLVREARLRAHKLREAVRTDYLTGLQSPEAAEETLGRELARAGRAGHPLCVAMIDFDTLKAVNDAHGHQAGARALKESAAAWRSVLRADDSLGRFGGDEFVLIIVDASLEQGLNAAERLRRTTPEPHSCSIGVACWDGAESGKELIHRADVALYEAKRSGRARTVAAGLGPTGAAAPSAGPGVEDSPLRPARSPR